MRKAFLTLILALLSLASKAVIIDGIGYYLNGDNASVIVETVYNEDFTESTTLYYKGDLVIPSTVEYEGKTYTVTRVDLYGCSELQSVSLPNTIREIAEFGFYGCTQLTGITLPSSLEKIGRSAFSYCENLEEITIPQSVKEIGGQAFSVYCTSLKRIIIEDIGAWCDIDMEDAIISEGTSVYLDDDELEYLVIPETVTTIKPYVFSCFTGIDSVYIPAKVDSIGLNAFRGCKNISKVTAEDLASWCDIHFGTTYFDYNDNPIMLSNPVAYANNLYIGDEQLTELVIPEGVDSIGNGAFSHCYGITDVSFPSTLRYVGGAAFEGCRNIQIVNITSLEDYCRIRFVSIDSNPFRNYMTTGSFTWMLINGEYVYDLSELRIPDSIEKIEANAFAKVDNNSTIVIPASVEEIGDYAFYTSVHYLNTLYIDGHIEKMGEEAFGNCPYIGTIYMKDPNPAAISERTFYNLYTPRTNVPLGTDYNYRNTRLMVPAGSRATYQNTDGWNLFQNIEEYETSEVGIIGQDAAGIRRYTIDGRAATPQTKGIVIEQMPDGTIRKTNL